MCMGRRGWRSGVERFDSVYCKIASIEPRLIDMRRMHSLTIPITYLGKGRL